MLTSFKMQPYDHSPLPGRLLPTRELRVWEQLYDQVGKATKSQTGPLVVSKVRFRIYWPVKDQVYTPVLIHIWNQIYRGTSPEDI